MLNVVVSSAHTRPGVGPPAAKSPLGSVNHSRPSGAKTQSFGASRPEVIRSSTTPFRTRWILGVRFRGRAAGEGIPAVLGHPDRAIGPLGQAVGAASRLGEELWPV